MTTSEAQALLDNIVGQVLGFKNPLTLDQFMQKFAFDIRLPQQVTDNYDGSKTWAQSINPTRFMKMENARHVEIGGVGPDTDWLRPKKPINSIEDIMAAWSDINYTTTERYIDTLNVSESDNVSFSENVYRSQDVHKCKNVLFTDGLNNSEFVAAGQRSVNSTFCIRIDDSGECSNCFSVQWCARLTNCFFMHDAGDMQDSMFCTNIKGKQFCIANMQYDEAEYIRIREIVARWILTQ